MDREHIGEVEDRYGLGKHRLPMLTSIAVVGDRENIGLVFLPRLGPQILTQGSYNKSPPLGAAGILGDLCEIERLARMTTTH